MAAGQHCQRSRHLALSGDPEQVGGEHDGPHCCTRGALLWRRLLLSGIAPSTRPVSLHPACPRVWMRACIRDVQRTVERALRATSVLLDPFPPLASPNHVCRRGAHTTPVAQLRMSDAHASRRAALGSAALVAGNILFGQVPFNAPVPSLPCNPLPRGVPCKFITLNE